MENTGKSITEREAEKVCFRVIGTIRSPHLDAAKTPIQPVFASDCLGTVELSEDFAAGLDDLEGFSHIILLYYLHKAEKTKLRTRPFLQDRERGVFATRSPSRPNKIGFSVVRLLERKGRFLKVAGVDVLDGTPLLDIKPYVARFDLFPGCRNGWLEEVGDDEADRRGRRDMDKKG